MPGQSAPDSAPASDTTDSGPTPGERKAATEAARLRAARAEKLKAASGTASAWAAKSGKRTAALTAAASRGVVANVRSWRADQVRRILVSIIVPGALAATAVVAGVFADREILGAELLRPDLTLVSPNQYSLFIWALIGVGMLGYVVHQWLPRQVHSPRHRGLGWIVMAALLLNLALTWLIREELHTESLVVHGLLLLLLLVSLRWLNRWSAFSSLEGALVDVPLGLFLGWTGFTALTHTAAVLSLNGFSWLTGDEFVWALIGLGIIVLVGGVVCSLDRGRMAVALAAVWGMAWIIVERLLGQPQSLLMAGATALAAFLLLITAGSRRHRVDHSYRRELRRRQTSHLPPIELDDEDYEYYEEEPEPFEDGEDPPPRPRRVL